MDFNDTPEEAAFRAEARGWLEANAESLGANESVPGMGKLMTPEIVAEAQAWQKKKAESGFKKAEARRAALAKAHLGKSKGPIHAVVFTDADMLRDEFWVRVQNLFGQTITIPVSDNMNIVTNASDAVEGTEKGLVRVETGYDSQTDLVRVVVTDNGPGISAEHLDRIFNIFESTKGARGTGLGLAVSEKIIHEHGGEIRVESRPGEGCRFELSWPRIDEDRRNLESPTLT